MVGGNDALVWLSANEGEKDSIFSNFCSNASKYLMSIIVVLI